MQKKYYEKFLIEENVRPILNDVLRAITILLQEFYFFYHEIKTKGFCLFFSQNDSLEN